MTGKEEVLVVVFGPGTRKRNMRGSEGSFPD